MVLKNLSGSKVNYSGKIFCGTMQIFTFHSLVPKVFWAPQNGETDPDADHKRFRKHEDVRPTNVKSEKPPFAVFFL